MMLSSKVVTVSLEMAGSMLSSSRVRRRITPRSDHRIVGHPGAVLKYLAAGLELELVKLGPVFHVRAWSPASMFSVSLAISSGSLVRLRRLSLRSNCAVMARSI